MFLLVTFKRIKLESRATSQITQNKISCPKLSYFLKIDEDLCEILSEQVRLRCLLSCHRPLMIGLTNGGINGRTNGQIKEQSDVGTNGRMNGQLDGWTESWTNGEMGGWTQALIEVLAKSDQHLWNVKNFFGNICQAVSTSTLFNQIFYAKLSVHMSGLYAQLSIH